MPPYCRSSSIWSSAITGKNRVYFIRVKHIKRVVRRWSRIVSFEFNTWADTPRSHLVSFRLFRKVTRFKRFNFGITKFRRRSWFRLKSRKNWIYFHFTLSKGLELYRLFRSLYKYQFYNSMLNLNSPSFISPWFKEHNFIFSELPNENYAWYCLNVCWA